MTARGGGSGTEAIRMEATSGIEIISLEEPG